MPCTQVRHASASLHPVRRGNQQSPDLLARQSKERGINPKIAATWGKYVTAEDMRAGLDSPVRGRIGDGVPTAAIEDLGKAVLRRFPWRDVVLFVPMLLLPLEDGLRCQFPAIVADHNARISADFDDMIQYSSNSMTGKRSVTGDLPALPTEVVDHSHDSEAATVARTVREIKQWERRWPEGSWRGPMSGTGLGPAGLSPWHPGARCSLAALTLAHNEAFLAVADPVSSYRSKLSQPAVSIAFSCVPPIILQREREAGIEFCLFGLVGQWWLARSFAVCATSGPLQGEGLVEKFVPQATVEASDGGVSRVGLRGPM